MILHYWSWHFSAQNLPWPPPPTPRLLLRANAKFFIMHSTALHDLAHDGSAQVTHHLLSDSAPTLPIMVSPYGFGQAIFYLCNRHPSSGFVPDKLHHAFLKNLVSGNIVSLIPILTTLLALSTFTSWSYLSYNCMYLLYLCFGLIPCRGHCPCH